jgi:hypothetical protein
MMFCDKKSDMLQKYVEVLKETILYIEAGAGNCGVTLIYAHTIAHTWVRFAAPSPKIFCPSPHT